MYVDPFNRIGSGRIRHVQISDNGNLKKVEARGGLCGGDIRVAIMGPLRGKILIPVWLNIVGHTAMRDDKYEIKYHDQKYLLYQVFNSIYDAERYTYHLLEEQYGITYRHGEKGQLLKARQALEEYNIVVSGLRIGNAHELGITFLEMAQSILEQIGKSPRDENKRKARDMTISLATVFDRLERVNPSAKMAVSVGVMNKLKQRTLNISCIEPHIIARRLILKSIIEEMELYLEGVYNFLSLLFHPKNSAIEMLRSATRDSIVQQLGFYVQQISRYDIAPFDRTATHVSSEFSNASFFIRHYQAAKARDELRKSWNSLALSRVRTEIEDVILQITFMLFGKPTSVNQKQCDGVITRLRQLARRLTKVDESGFKHPVAKKVISQVRTADRLVVKKTVPELKEAKAVLKQAATLL